MADSPSFRPFRSTDAKDFKALNVEWLEAYFVVEPYDELVLSHPQSEILDKGGVIFMVLLGSQTIGTFAFINKGERCYEFSKMALHPNERGKGYGNLIMQFAIRYAEQHHWRTLLLYSSTKLKNSIYLYRKYGFVEVPLETEIRYARGDIKMVLELND